jgi:hypothetical protein
MPITNKERPILRLLSRQAYRSSACAIGVGVNEREAVVNLGILAGSADCCNNSMLWCATGLALAAETSALGTWASASQLEETTKLVRQTAALSRQHWTLSPSMVTLSSQMQEKAFGDSSQAAYSSA